MSSFYLSTTRHDQVDTAEIACQLKFTANSWSQEFTLKNLAVVCTRVDDPKIWSSYYDDSNNTLIIIGGRIAFEPSEWSALESNENKEALVAREILNRYQHAGTKALTDLNGGYCIIIYEANKSQLILCTDRLGIFPVFGYQLNNPNKLILCTHPDVLANAIPQGWNFDMITMAGFLHTGQGVHPHTFYQEIKELDSGTLYKWDFQKEQVDYFQYWNPEPNPEPKSNSPELIIEFAEALHKAVERRTQSILGKVGVFLSGGTDSRIPLFNATNRKDLTGITLYDAENRELAAAKKVAEHAHAKHLLIQRDLNYYPKIAIDVMRIAGGMWNFTDCHYHGALDEINSYQFGTILSGDFADCLFKGLLLNKKHYTFLGKKLPFVTRGKFDYKYYLWFRPVSEKWQVEVHKRFSELYKDITTSPQNDLDLMRIEQRRLIPVSRIDSAEGNVLWRTLPWDPFFCDKDLLDIYQRIPISLKLNGTLFNKAVSHLCKEANDIPNGNTGVSIDAPLLSKVNSIILKPWLLEFMGKAPQTQLSSPHASQTLWPNWSYIMSHSPVINDLWTSTDQETIDLISELLGWNPWNKTTKEWGQTDQEFFTRILSLSLWYRLIRGQI
jgi:asparagine synthase (glutamine-hydrolysing)